MHVSGVMLAALRHSSRRRTSRRQRLLLVTLAGAIAALSAMGAIALAGGSDPAITIGQSGGGVLFGSTQTVTLTATNPSSQTDWGYNLSYEATLPANTTYVATTSANTPAPSVYDNVPSAGETTVVWQNVADLSPGSSNSISFTVTHSTTAFQPGSQYTINSGAYVNNLVNVRQVPQFSPTTGAASMYTGSATTSQTSTISAIQLTTSEPSPEGKLLRGVHNDRTIYTLTVTNNSVKQTTGVSVTEYLPADLEFLGCGTDDNTGGSEGNPGYAPTNPGSTLEYPGAAALNAGGAPGGLANCVTPTSVTTASTTPPGASSPGVYTVVTFPVGTLAAGASVPLEFVAGVPLRSNTTTWDNESATAPSGILQESNLENNSGALTYHGENATIYGQAAGEYNGVTAVTSNSSLSRTIMNIRILKSADSGALVQGQDTTWTLTVQTGEYRYFTPVTVTDTVPSGLCPINYPVQTTTDGECQGASGDAPSLAWDNTPAEADDGTWTLHWTLPDTLGPDSTYVIAYHTRTRTHYREGRVNTTTISSNDSVTNNVALASMSFAKCVNGDDECTIDDDTLIGDDSSSESNPDSDSATLTAAAPTISKTIQQTSSQLADCATGTYGSTPPPGLVPGDQVCYELRVVFPAGVDTQTPTVTDFLPPNMAYVPGSAVTMTDDTVDASDLDVNGNTLTWTLGSDVAPGQVFDVAIAGTVAQNLVTYPAGYLTGNLMKTNFANTPGTTFPNRAEQDFTLTAPSIDIYKGVAAFTPPGGGTTTESGPNIDDVTVPGDSSVEWRVDVENQGGEAATGEIWDFLPGGLTCDSVSSISNFGTCVTNLTTGDYIDWTNINLPANSTIANHDQTELTYDTAIGTGFSPGQLISSSAGVHTFTTTDNQGDSDTYFPQNNIDSSVTTGEENAPAANDASSIQLTALGFTHKLSTTVNQSGNVSVSQASSGTATIGEDVTYTDTLTVPNGTTIYANPEITTTLPSTLSSTTSVTATYDGSSTLPTNWTVSASGNSTPSLSYSGGSWTNTTGSNETFVLAYTANVLDVSGNVKGDVISDSASLDYTDQALTAHVVTPSAATVTVVEPSITTSLTSSAPGGSVMPGSTYTYTATFGDASGSHNSEANDNTLAVTVPAGLTPWSASSGGSAVSDGGSDNGWIWDAETNTLSYAPAAVAPGAAATVPTFFLNVNSPAISGSKFSTTVVADTTSYPGSPPNGTERTVLSATHTGYTATQTNVVTLAPPVLTKAVSPTTTTFGSTVVYTVTVALAANVTYYDTTLLDTIPTGISYDGGATITGCSGCTGPDDTPSLQSASSGSTVAFFLGVSTASPSTSIPTSPDARTVTITFNGHVNATATDGTGKTNNSINVYDDTSSLDSSWPGSPPSPSSFNQTGAAVSAATTVAEPTPTITKTVTGGDATGHVGPGDTPTYTLTVKNTSSSWPLYNVAVSDTPSSLYTNIALAGGVSTSYNTQAWTTAGSTITWLIPSIPVSGTVTLSYTGTLPASTALHSGAAIDNSANVTSSYAFDSEDDGMFSGYTPKDYTAGPAPQNLTWDPPFVSIAQAPAGSSTATICSPFTWQVTLTNTSHGATADNVNVTDTIPADWTYVTGSSQVGGVGVGNPTQSGQTLTWTDLVASLPAGDNDVLTFEATPTLQAALTYGIGMSNPYSASASDSWSDTTGATADADGAYASGPATANAYLNPSADLGVTKTLESSPTLTEGNTVTYQLVFTNNTSTTGAFALDAVGSDTLPTLLDPTSVSLASAPAWSPTTSYSTGNEVSSGGENWTATLPSTDQTPATGPYWSSEASVCGVASQTVTCTWPFLGPGAVRTVDVQAAVQSVSSGSISNTATISTTSIDPVNSNNSATTTNAVVHPALTLSKTYSGTSINTGTGQPGDTITYDLAIHNSGTATAYDVAVTDKPNSALTNVTDTTNAGDETTTWSGAGSSMAWFINSIAAGATVHLDYTATLTSGVWSAEAISNTAHITDYWDASQATREANDTFDWTDYPSVSSTATFYADVPYVTLTDNTGATGHPNSANSQILQPFGWHLVFTNTTAATAYSVVVTDTLPADYSYVGGSAKLNGVTIGDPSISGSTLTFSATGTASGLADGDSVTIDFTTIPSTAAAAQGQPETNEAYAAWKDGAGSSSSLGGAYQTINEPAYAELTVPDLTVTKTVASPTVDAGASTDYTITVDNTGNAPARDVAIDDHAAQRRELHAQRGDRLTVGRLQRGVRQRPVARLAGHAARRRRLGRDHIAGDTRRHVERRPRARQHRLGDEQRAADAGDRQRRSDDDTGRRRVAAENRSAVRGRRHDRDMDARGAQRRPLRRTLGADQRPAAGRHDLPVRRRRLQQRDQHRHLRDRHARRGRQRDLPHHRRDQLRRDRIDRQHGDRVDDRQRHQPIQQLLDVHDHDRQRDRPGDHQHSDDCGDRRDARRHVHASRDQRRPVGRLQRNGLRHAAGRPELPVVHYIAGWLRGGLADRHMHARDGPGRNGAQDHYPCPRRRPRALQRHRDGVDIAADRHQPVQQQLDRGTDRRRRGRSGADQNRPVHGVAGRQRHLPADRHQQRAARRQRRDDHRRAAGRRHIRELLDRMHGRHDDNGELSGRCARSGRIEPAVGDRDRAGNALRAEPDRHRNRLGRPAGHRPFEQLGFVHDRRRPAGLARRDQDRQPSARPRRRGRPLHDRPRRAGRGRAERHPL